MEPRGQEAPEGPHDQPVLERTCSPESDYVVARAPLDIPGSDASSQAVPEDAEHELLDARGQLGRAPYRFPWTSRGTLACRIPASSSAHRTDQLVLGSKLRNAVVPRSAHH